MKLTAVLACRNQSSRLYAKPLQNLDHERGIGILDYLIAQLQKHSIIDEIILAISDREENSIYIQKSKTYGIPYVLGDDDDVLGRLIRGAREVNAEHILRVTTESPYPCLDSLRDVFMAHRDEQGDYSTILGLPDGASYEIIRVEALQQSWDKGEKRHRSELCTLYIREHQEQFRIVNHKPLFRIDPQKYRLTVDWPEDLIVMRAIYKGIELDPFKALDFKNIIEFLDCHPEINAINNWIDSGVGRAWY